MTNNITSEWLIEELSDFLYTFSDTKSGTFVTKANELLRAYNKDRDDLVSDLIAFATNQQRMDLDIGLLELFENSVLLKEVREQSNKSAECSSIHASLNESHFDKSSMEIVESSFNDSLTFKRGSTAGETIHPKYAALTPVKNSKSNIEYQQRTDSGKVVIKYKGKSFSEHRSGEKYGNVQIENLCENMDTLKYYGNDKEVEQVDAICSRIEILKDAILDGVSNGFLHFQQCDHVSHDEFAIYGQIVEENGESLDFSNCCLQTNDETGTTIKLELENLSEFALFPGKVVAFRGYNETGSLFTATTIHEPKILDMAAITSEKGVRAQVEIWCAAGPFTSPDTFSFEQFYDLLEMARNERPDVLILIAPFIDRNSSVSNSPDLMLTWQEMFECLLVNISDMMVKSNVSVVLIPICRVDANSLPIYPTPPFHISSECRALLNKNVMLLTDPCKIRICGVSFMITSAEILKHLSKEEIHRCESGKEGDRMSRLIQHLIRQRSPYPLYPSSLEIPVIPARLINTYSFEAIPHIMLLPSALAPMVKFYIRHMHHRSLQTMYTIMFSVTSNITSWSTIILEQYRTRFVLYKDSIHNPLFEMFTMRKSDWPTLVRLKASIVDREFVDTICSYFMRPSEEVLNKFYDLAEYTAEKRRNAICDLLTHLSGSHEVETYCVERLIEGLASSRAAARVGYANALTQLLIQSWSNWPAQRLFEIVDRKLDLNDSDASAKALGQHLTYTAMVHCKKYVENIADVFTRELAIMDKCSFFAMAVCDTLALAAKCLDCEAFEAKLWTVLCPRISESLATLKPEWLFFMSSVGRNFPKAFIAKTNYLSKKGKFSLKGEHWNELNDLLKKCDGCADFTLVSTVLSSLMKNGSFEQAYKRLVEERYVNSDSVKARSWLLNFVKHLLSKDGNLTSEQILIIFSTKFVNLLKLTRVNYEYRFLSTTADSVIASLEKSISLSIDWTSEQFYRLLKNFDAVESGNFDKCFPNWKITEKLILQMNDAHIKEFITEASMRSIWVLRRYVRIFSHLSSKMQKKLLQTLIEQSKCAEIHNAFCSSIESMFIVKVRAGRGLATQCDQQILLILKKILKSYGICSSVPSIDQGPVAILSLVLSAWSLTTPTKDERVMYTDMASEANVVLEKLSKDRDEALPVLLDLLLSLMSRKHRFHRGLINYVFSSVAPSFTYQHVHRIVEVINSSDEELFGSALENSAEKDEESDEDVSIDEQDSSSKTEDERMETDDTKENIPDISPRSSDSDDDNASVPSNLDDEAMFRLDEHLSAAFRERFSKFARGRTTLIEDALQLRLKSLDLLMLIVSSSETEHLAVELIIPLVKTARESLHKKENEMIFQRSMSLLNLIIRFKKSALSVPKALDLIDQLVEVTALLINPVLRNCVANVTSFLFSVCYNHETNRIPDEVRTKINELFAKYMLQTKNEIQSEVACAPFNKYPKAFLPSFRMIVEFAFNEEVRIFRRTEALSCALAFMRRDVLKGLSEEEKETKVYAGMAKRLGIAVQDYLSKFNVADAKPRFFAFVIRLLTAFASNVDAKYKAKLARYILKDLNRFIEGQGIGGGGGDGKFKRFNSASQAVCGRNTLSALKNLINLLD